jgi:hypothetical protein
MKPLAKLGYLGAACALLITTLSIIGPRAVRAAAAELVQVTNTAANPALIELVDAKNAFQARFGFDSVGIDSASQSVVIPPGERLVVDFISIGAFANSTSGTFAPYVDLRSGLNGGSADYAFEPTPIAVAGINELSQSIKIYADTLTVIAGTNTNVTGTIVVDISGHLVAVP